MIDEEARDELLNLGVRSTPALVVDGKVAAGFDKTCIDRLLRIGDEIN